MPCASAQIHAQDDNRTKFAHGCIASPQVMNADRFDLDRAK
ncbi:hypothetical protein [Accumulibacter sp.]|nr:hypothetical protein [Accumulibacter sp.]